MKITNTTKRQYLVDPETKGVAVGGTRIKSVEKISGNKIKINDYKNELSKTQVANIQRAIKKNTC